LWVPLENCLLEYADFASEKTMKKKGNTDLIVLCIFVDAFVYSCLVAPSLNSPELKLFEDYLGSKLGLS
jgi:hypothetical protein